MKWHNFYFLLYIHHLKLQCFCNFCLTFFSTLWIWDKGNENVKVGKIHTVKKKWNHKWILYHVNKKQREIELILPSEIRPSSFFSSALISLIPISALSVVMHCLASLSAGLVFSNISVYRCVSIWFTKNQKNNETSMTLVFLCGYQQILQKCTIQLYSQITCYLQITLLLSTRSFIYGNELNIENEEIMILIIIIIIIIIIIKCEYKSFYRWSVFMQGGLQY